MKKIEELEKNLNEKKIDSIYFFYGEELYLLEQSIKKIRKIFGECIKGINYILIDETNIGNIISDIETPAFGYEKKLIIAKNSGILKKEGKKKSQEMTKLKERLSEYLKENIGNIKQSVIIIFIEEDTDARQELYKTIDKLGTICKFEYQNPLQLQKRIKLICTENKVKINDNTLKYFIECVGTNMQEVINEVTKLIQYVGENGEIKNEDIDKLSIKKLESIIFDLTDNLGKKEIAQALNVLQNLIYAKEPIQKILITLYNHFKKIYLTKIAQKYNKDIALSLDLKPNQIFLVNKYKIQAKYFKTFELKEILQNLRDLDYNYKNGLIDLQVGLESILCRYCS